MKTFLIAIIFILFLIIPPVSGQILLGPPAKQAVEITLDENGIAYVTHKVDKLNKAQHIILVRDDFTNLKVTDIEGIEVEHGITRDDDIAAISLFPTKKDVLVKYDLNEAVILKNKVWTWDFRYLESTTFIFPENVELVFVNKQPVNVSGGEKIRCHGCQMKLEYVINEPTIIKKVSWDNQDFVVVIKTLAEVKNMYFDQPTKKIGFSVNDDNHLITLVIPLKLLWNPYEVYLDGEKILKHEFSHNQTHIWLNIRPETSGTVQIIGTSVVPEFPLFTPLVIGFTAIIGIQLLRKFNPR